MEEQVAESLVVLRQLLEGQQAQRQQDHDQAEARRARDQLNGKPDKKVTPLASDRPEAFFEFKRLFRNVVVTNNWSHTRARRELFGAMTGDAAHIVAAIPVGDVAVQPEDGGAAIPVAPWEQLMDAYEAALLPANAMETYR